MFIEHKVHLRVLLVLCAEASQLRTPVGHVLEMNAVVLQDRGGPMGKAYREILFARWRQKLVFFHAFHPLMHRCLPPKAAMRSVMIRSEEHTSELKSLMRSSYA